MKKKTAIILGATGLVGSHLVDLLIKSSDYDTIEIWVRSTKNKWPQGIAERVVNFDKLEEEDLIADEVFCCLGTTIKKAGSKTAFEKVDYHYPLSAALLAKKSGTKLFAIVTAMGSNQNSNIFYNKVKGKIEHDLQQVGFDHTGIFRPSMLLGDRSEFRLGEALGKVFMPAFKFLIPKKYQAIQAQKVAEAMSAYARNPEKGTSIIENHEML